VERNFCNPWQRVPKRWGRFRKEREKNEIERWGQFSKEREKNEIEGYAYHSDSICRVFNRKG
jgi:hypothetical protein